MNRLGLVGFLALSLFFASSSSAVAYFDPGTGAIILQLLLGGVAGAAMVAKLYWSRLMEMVGRVTGRMPQQHTPSNPQGNSEPKAGEE